MFVGAVLAALALALLLWVLRNACSKPANFPPGPPRLPIWGSYLQVVLHNFRFPYRALHAMARRYNTKVLGYYFGPIAAVVACDYDSVKEVLTNPHIQGRGTNVSIRARQFGKDLGVFFVDGDFWKEQRWFALRYLRDFGYGRRSHKLETEIEAEVRDLLELFGGIRKNDALSRPAPGGGGGGQLVLLPDALFTAATNCLLPLYTGARAPRDAVSDADAVQMGRSGLQFSRSTDTTGRFVTLHPWLAYLFPKYCGHSDIVDSNRHHSAFIEKIIDEHQKTFCEDEMRGFIDVYLKEMKSKQKSGELTNFTDEQLLVMLVDFLIPSVTTVSVAITWFLMCLVHHPRVLRRLQEEMDTVVGRGRLPTLDDRSSLPYLEASLRESFRLCTATPISVPHRATQDTTLKGYFIPKDTMVIPCLWSVHMDEDLWGDPTVYRPERFIDSEGKLVKKDYTMPFSAGKRLCPGETFSRQNIFLICGAIVQNFSIDPDGVPPLNSNIPGIVETQPSFWARFTPR